MQVKVFKWIKKAPDKGDFTEETHFYKFVALVNVKFYSNLSKKILRTLAQTWTLNHFD